ncbi:MAG: hypothetical protein ACYC3Q_16385 [Gemmatimonadaceae bacterium]
MDPIMTHLRINHFPIVLGVLGAAATVLALAWRRRAAWRYALITLIVAAITVYPAVFTGTRAEGETRKHWFVERGSWKDHEEAGELAMWIMLATGGLAAYALWRERGYQRIDRGNQPQRIAAPIWLQALVALGALASAAAVGRAGLEGGEITHGNKQLMTPPPGWVAPPAPPRAAPQ